MELLKAFNLKLINFFLIIFILLFIFLLFIIMRNKEIIKNKNIKNYKEIVKENQNNKLVLKLGKLFKILSLTIIIYFIILFILTAITFVLFPMAVGDGFSGLNTSGYELFFKYYGYYLNIVKYIWIFMVIDFLIYLVRTIICNCLNYKELKDNYEVNINKMNIKVLSNFVLIILLIATYVIFSYEIAVLFSSNLKFDHKSDVGEIVDFNNIVNTKINEGTKLTNNWYFVYNDKFYAYNYDFFETSLKGYNKKVISSSDELNYANIFLTYKDNVYYYALYNNKGIKKLNLETGDIEMVIKDKYLNLLPDTLKDNQVLVNNTNNQETYFAYLNLDDNSLSNEKVITNQSDSYFYDLKTNKVYYLKDNNVYEDNKLIYTFKDNNKLERLAFIQDNYLFVIYNRTIYKFSLDNYKLLKEKKLDNYYYLIDGNRKNRDVFETSEELNAEVSLYPIFTGSNGEYLFDSKTLNFKKINNNARISFVQKYKDYYIIQGIDLTCIYNIKTKKTKLYYSVNFSIDNDYLYLMRLENYKYYKIKKIDINQIEKEKDDYGN